MLKRLPPLLIVSSPRSPPRRRARRTPRRFDADLQRLAEILGSLHYLRSICGSNEGQKWRNEMTALMDAETPAGERRARMVASFNRGYNDFQRSYRSLHAGRDRRDQALSHGRLEDLARSDGPLRQLKKFSREVVLVNLSIKTRPAPACPHARPSPRGRWGPRLDSCRGNSRA